MQYDLSELKKSVILKKILCIIIDLNSCSSIKNIYFFMNILVCISKSSTLRSLTQFLQARRSMLSIYFTFVE